MPETPTPEVCAMDDHVTVAQLYEVLILIAGLQSMHFRFDSPEEAAAYREQRDEMMRGIGIDPGKIYPGFDKGEDEGELEDPK